jgi:hypothetical protein
MLDTGYWILDEKANSVYFEKNMNDLEIGLTRSVKSPLPLFAKRGDPSLNPEPFLPGSFLPEQ